MHSPVDRYLDYFQFEIIMNNAAMNLAGSYGMFIFNFLRSKKRKWKLHLTLRNPMDCIVHGILQLETRVGSLSLLQGIFPTQVSNPGLPHCRKVFYQLSHKGSPRMLEWVAYTFSSGSSQLRNCLTKWKHFTFSTWIIRIPVFVLHQQHLLLFIFSYNFSDCEIISPCDCNLHFPSDWGNRASFHVLISHLL